MKPITTKPGDAQRGKGIFRRMVIDEGAEGENSANSMCYTCPEGNHFVMISLEKYAEIMTRLALIEDHLGLERAKPLEIRKTGIH